MIRRVRKFKMKNILSQLTKKATDTFLPNASVHGVPLIAQDRGLTPNTLRVASKVIENYFLIAPDTVGLEEKGGRPKSTSRLADKSFGVNKNKGAAKVLASKPVFTTSGSKVVINVFYYIPGAKNQALSNGTVNSLGEALSKLFKRPVELRLVRLHYPYLNSHILAQYIAINSRKYNFTRIQRAIFSAVRVVRADTIMNSEGVLLPAYITGVRIKIGGRLATQRSVPRQTVQTAQIGTFSTGALHSNNITTSSAPKLSSVVEYSSFTSKNRKGAFTVKVWISQAVY
jgi:hypothetical protein